MDGTTENIRQTTVYVERGFGINCLILFILMCTVTFNKNLTYFQPIFRFYTP